MLKIYNVRSVFQINRQQWETCGDAGYICKDDSEIQEELVVLDKCSFDKAFCEIYNNCFDGLYADETPILHRPYIGVTGRCSLRGVQYCAKDIHTISYKVIYRERKHVSIDWITKHLTADQAIQYFKERGMTVCPINLQ